MGEKVIVTAGQEAIGVPGQPIALQATDGRSVEWLQGRYSFNKLNLAHIATKLERLYGVPIILDTNSLLHEKITGVLDKNKSLTANLDKLKELIEFRYYFHNGTLHISRI